VASKKRPAKTRRLLPEADFEVLPPDPEEETLSDILSQFGGVDVQIKVYRLDQGMRQYCATLTNPTEASEEFVRGLGYGAGRYVLHIIIDGAFRKALPMAIAEKIGSGGKEETPLTRLVLDRMTQLEQRLTVQPAREPINDLADAMLKLQTMTQPQQSRAEMSPETILQWVQLGRELGSGGSDESLAGMLKEIAPAAIQALFAARGVTSPQQLAGMQPANGNGGNVDAMLQLKLKAGIAFLKRKCLNNGDPGLYVDFIVGNQDEPEFQHLIHAAVTKEFSAFVQIDPEIGKEPFEAFFKSIYDGIRQVVSESNSMAVVEAGKGGDSADVRSNGGSGKKSSK